VEAAGIEGDRDEQSLDGSQGVSISVSCASVNPVGDAESVSQPLAEPHCHTVTLALAEALRSLDAGRVDLARVAIRRALTELARDGEEPLS
jgi:hypothetical protein